MRSSWPKKRDDLRLTRDGEFSDLFSVKRSRGIGYNMQMVRIEVEMLREDGSGSHSFIDLKLRIGSLSYEPCHHNCQVFQSVTETSSGRRDVD